MSNPKSTTAEDRALGEGILVPLTQGLSAIIDLADAEEVLRFKWSACRCRDRIYAVRVEARDGGGIARILMHRQILGAPQGVLVDHRFGEGLDNRRGNLRIATKSQNQFNRGACEGSSRFKGVSWHAASQKWQVHIRAEGRRVYGGLFSDEIEAARAFDARARDLHGEFAQLNFPFPGERHAALGDVVQAEAA